MESPSRYQINENPPPPKPKRKYQRKKKQEKPIPKKQKKGESTASIPPRMEFFFTIFFHFLIEFHSLGQMVKDGENIEVQVLEEGEIAFDPDRFLEEFNSPKLPCPLHEDVSLQEKVASNGWEYFSCPVYDQGVYCFVLTGKDKSQEYLEKLCCWRIAMSYYKDNLNKMLCYCNQSLMLSISKSKDNPNRFYLRCRRNKCRFFQWADRYPSARNKAWFEGREYYGSADPLYKGQEVNRNDPPRDEAMWKQCQEEVFYLKDDNIINLPPELTGQKYSKDMEGQLRNQLYFKRMSNPM